MNQVKYDKCHSFPSLRSGDIVEAVDGKPYIIAQVDYNKFNLISLGSGNRYFDTNKELNNILGAVKFLIKAPVTIVPEVKTVEVTKFKAGDFIRITREGTTKGMSGRVYSFDKSINKWIIAFNNSWIGSYTENEFEIMPNKTDMVVKPETVSKNPLKFKIGDTVEDIMGFYKGMKGQITGYSERLSEWKVDFGLERIGYYPDEAIKVAL